MFYTKNVSFLCPLLSAQRDMNKHVPYFVYTTKIFVIQDRVGARKSGSWGTTVVNYNFWQLPP